MRAHIAGDTCGAGTGLARYTMPKPYWAVVEFQIEPMTRGYGVSYHGRPLDRSK